jgi:TonB-linked SusC/RagA family outer membrane protein
MMNHKIFYVLIFLLVCLKPQAQQNTDYLIEGVVYDEIGEPLTGVTLYLKDKVTLGAFSDSKGEFSIKASRGNTIVFTFMGYENREYLVTEEKKDVEIHLALSSQEVDEVVVVGMGTQRKISTVAAVSTIDVKELQVPAPSITNMLGGKIAGVITRQNSGEPGRNLAEFWVRGIGTFGANGNALVLIDGLEGDLNSIDPADIESFSILKDASATAVYGVRGANGVVLVTTKRGVEGKLQITFRSNFSLSHVVRLPKYLRAYDYALLANEAYELRGEEPRYNGIQLNVIKDGLDPDLYPDVNWQDEIINKNSFRQTYFASASGGGSVARYYASLGVSDESAAYKAEANNPYASNSGYKTYTFRMNLNLNLTKSTEVYFGSDAFMSINNRPGQADTDYIWQAQSRLSPLLFPTKYSNGQLPAGSSDTGLFSPYVLINHTGRWTSQNYQSMLTMAINQNLSAIAEGLRLRVQGAYNRDGYLEETRYTVPALHRALGRNSKGDLVTSRVFDGTNVNYTHSNWEYRKFHFEGNLSYDHAFDTHRVGGLIYYYVSDQQHTNDLTNSLNAIPVRYQGVSSRLTYGYNDTYLMDVNFGYTGSENFTPGKQYGFFPSLALGWVPTGYQWVQDQLEWLSFLKIRGSYGLVGNDRITDTRFPYLTRVGTGTTNPWGSSGSVETAYVNRVGADNLEWEKSIKTNLGFDLRLIKDKIALTMDFFNDQRNGIFQERIQIPDYIGLTNNPFGNVGKMKSWGSEGTVSFSHNMNKDMGFIVRGNYTFSQNLVQNWERLNEKYPYQEWHGQPLSGVRGYQCIGFFKDEDDIRYSPKQTFGDVRPGDLKYKDINGDGKVDGDDAVPLSFRGDMYPLLMYGFGGEFRYKNLSLGVLFRGTGKVDYFRDNWGYIPFAGGDIGNVLEPFKDPATRWIPKEYAVSHGIDPNLAENPNALLPRLQFGDNSNNSQTSDFWKGDARYLRLQEITLNYNIKNDFLKKIGISSIDVQLVGNNLYVWDKVKLFDPEQANRLGEVYPIPAVYSLQLYIRL